MDSPIDIKSEIEIEDYDFTYNPSYILSYNNNNINYKELNIKSENKSKATNDAEENQTKILEKNSLKATIKIEEIEESELLNENANKIVSKTADCSTSNEKLVKKNKLTTYGENDFMKIKNQPKISCKTEETAILDINNLKSSIKIESDDESFQINKNLDIKIEKDFEEFVDSTRENNTSRIVSENNVTNCLIADEKLLENSGWLSVEDGEKNNETERFLTHWKQIHADKGPHKCNVCERSFSNSSKLWFHKKISSPAGCISVHSEEASFTCEVCSKVFSRAVHLKNHMLTHSALKPYSCKVCNKQYSVSGNLSAHMRQHTGEKAFTCEICKKAFWRADHLKNHLVTHSGMKPYSCTLCTKQYTQINNLYLHIKKIHGKIQQQDALM